FEDAWSGLRPGTPDGWPILGDSPVRGLYFAAGHFRSGILLAPVTARRVADVILGAGSGARPDSRLEAFSIERVAGRLSLSWYLLPPPRLPACPVRTFRAKGGCASGACLPWEGIGEDAPRALFRRTNRR